VASMEGKGERIKLPAGCCEVCVVRYLFLESVRGEEVGLGWQEVWRHKQLIVTAGPRGQAVLSGIDRKESPGAGKYNFHKESTLTRDELVEFMNFGVELKKLQWLSSGKSDF